MSSFAQQSFLQRRKLWFSDLSEVPGEVSDEVSTDRVVSDNPVAVSSVIFHYPRIASDSHLYGILQFIKPLLITTFIELHNNPV